MTRSDLSFCRGHRERLRQKFLDGHMADYELVEMMLTFVIPRRDVRELSRELLRRFGGIHQILCASMDDLMEVPGMGRNTAIFIKAMHSINIKAFKANAENVNIFHDDRNMKNYCLNLLSGKNIEEFHVLYMDKDKRLLKDDTHSVGTNDESPVYPREILKRALNVGARFILLCHNHPTFQTGVSSPDIDTTTQIIELAKPLGIDVLDHYVVSGGLVYSARDTNSLNGKALALLESA